MDSPECNEGYKEKRLSRRSESAARIGLLQGPPKTIFSDCLGIVFQKQDPLLQSQGFPSMCFVSCWCFKEMLNIILKFDHYFLPHVWAIIFVWKNIFYVSVKAEKVHYVDVLGYFSWQFVRSPTYRGSQSFILLFPQETDSAHKKWGEKNKSLFFYLSSAFISMCLCFCLRDKICFL